MITKQGAQFRTKIKVKGIRGILELVEVNQANGEQYRELIFLFIETAKVADLRYWDAVEKMYLRVLRDPTESLLLVVHKKEIIGLSSQQISNRSKLRFAHVLEEYRGHKLGIIMAYFVLNGIAPKDYLFHNLPDYYGGLRSGLYLGEQPRRGYDKKNKVWRISFRLAPGYENVHYINKKDKSIIVMPRPKYNTSFFITYVPPDKYTFKTRAGTFGIKRALASGKYKRIDGKLENAEKHFKYVKD